jgi:hypothetical protein
MDGSRSESSAVPFKAGNNCVATRGVISSIKSAGKEYPTKCFDATDIPDERTCLDLIACQRVGDGFLGAGRVRTRWDYVREVERSQGYKGVFPVNGAGMVKDADFARSLGNDGKRAIDIL